MTTRSVVSRVRVIVLQSVFRLLYTRLGFLHEAVGRTFYGPAWDGRRSHVVPVALAGTLLDIGCGEGRLLQSIAGIEVLPIGIEPSPAMSRRARNRGVQVVQASSQALPIDTATVRHVVATYPGPWIVDPRTWDEVARVTAAGATIRILLGGDISCGQGASIRQKLLRLAYGNEHQSGDELPLLGNDRVVGTYELVGDAWGTAIIWSGIRTGDESRPSRVATQPTDAST